MPQSSDDDQLRQRPAVPRWVKGFAAAGLALLLLALGMAISGHGPGRHFAMEAHDVQ